ncbi:MAG: hypothetical protein HAW67_06200 [Endozoicomonadaceae bacterium]|nr:hypothetical protein [Endozoicomonadaceae bacterium]
MKKIIKGMLHELKRLNNEEDIKIILQEWNEKNSIPTILNGIIFSPKLEIYIQKIQAELIIKKSNLKKRYTDAELYKLLKNEFSLKFPYLNLNDSDEKNIKEIKDTLNEFLKKTYGEVEHTFGCTLFSNMNNLPPFSIGPAYFENRFDWLERKKTEDHIPETIYERIKKEWDGDHLENTDETHDFVIAKSILNTIGSSPFVCSVTTKGFPPKTGEEKAIVGARLALTIISLAWEVPSNVINNFKLSYDPPTYNRYTLSFLESKNLKSSTALIPKRPFAIYMTNDKWKDNLKSYKNIFKLCGCVLNYFLTPFEEHDRKKVLDVFLHALIWFHAGCREKDDLIATVKYAACLDTLASGGGAGGTKNLITKQLEISPLETLFKNNPRTMKSIVEKIYTVRGRTIHGNNERLRQDWSEIRTHAEVLCRECLVSCLGHATEDSSLDNPTNFMEKRLQ